MRGNCLGWREDCLELTGNSRRRRCVIGVGHRQDVDLIKIQGCLSTGYMAHLKTRWIF
jgi:hypothetical protein